MSLYPSTFQLNPSLCLHLLCLLLLLTDSSSGASENVPVPADPLTHINTTQGNHGSISENAAKDSPETSSLQSPISDPNNTSWIFSATRDQSSPNSSSSNTHMSVSHKLKDTIAHLIPPNHSAGGNHSSMALPSSQQLVSPDPQPPSPETVLPSTITALPTQAAHTGSITSTGTITSTTAKPDIDVYADTVLVTSTTTTTRTTTTPTSTTTRTTTIPTSTTTTTRTTTTPTSTTTTTPTSTTTRTTTTPTSTTTRTTTTPTSTTITPTTTPTSITPTTTTTTSITTRSANTTVTIPTTTGTQMTTPSSSAAMPQPNAPMPPIQTSSLPKRPSTITVTSAITPTNHNDQVTPGTRVSMVEVAGGTLTRQLVDTASLLAVLLFGLLFFLVTVAVFVTQAYESYRRKDYTQVDYLINGMYTDSGV